MKTLPLTLLGVLSLFCSCHNIRNEDTEAEVFDFQIPYVQDTLKTDRVERDVIWLQNANYNPLYIGENRDSIYVSRRADLKKYSIYDHHPVSYNGPDSVGILLLMDTTKIISDYSLIWEDDEGTLNRKVFKAFPVFVVNTTRDTLDIGYGDHIPIIMEAKDKDGAWRPIEQPYIYFCGTGLRQIILPPNEMVVTSAPINKGKFKTRLRLRYNTTLSQEFYGAINPEQFVSKWKRL